MKRLIRIGVILVSFLFAYNSSFAQTGDFKLGGGVVLSTGATELSDLDNTFGFKVEGLYTIDEQWRSGADFTFYLPDEEGSAELTVWELNFNAHYLFHQKNDLSAYGIGGLNITSTDINVQGGGGSSGSEFGLNLGAGLEYALNFANVFGELKFGGIGGDADQFVFGAGMRFDI